MTDGPLRFCQVCAIIQGIGFAPVLRICPMFSPSVLKREAIATATTVVRGDFQVSPEGCYSIRGQRCTLNDAIIYAGQLAKQQA